MCSKDLNNLKKELEWLKEPDKCSLQNALKDLDNAYQKFFKEHTGYPKFKLKKNRYKSYRTSYTKTSAGGNKVFINKHNKLPKIGLVKGRDKQIPQGRILKATISQEPNGHYYCSLWCTDVEFEQYLQTNKNVGIDLGIYDFATLSDGIKIDNPRFYEQSENKLTTTIIRNYDLIANEKMDIKSMKETDSKLRNKRVGDVSWSEFRRMLSYKAQWYGKELSVIDRYYPSSQICSICGHREGKKSEDIRSWTCPHCHSELDRDVNAAINIMNEGLRLLNV